MLKKRTTKRKYKVFYCIYLSIHQYRHHEFLMNISNAANNKLCKRFNWLPFVMSWKRNIITMRNFDLFYHPRATASHWFLLVCLLVWISKTFALILLKVSRSKVSSSGAFEAGKKIGISIEIRVKTQKVCIPFRNGDRKFKCGLKP